MKRDCLKTKHPLAHKLLLAAGFAATVAASVLVIPRLANKFSACMIRNSASVDIPDEGPEIVRNSSADEQ